MCVHKAHWSEKEPATLQSILTVDPKRFSSPRYPAKLLQLSQGKMIISEENSFNMVSAGDFHIEIQLKDKRKYLTYRYFFKDFSAT